jgi:hypothetical protein
LWRLGKHKILCGDAREAGDLARVMNGAAASAVFCADALALDYLSASIVQRRDFASSTVIWETDFRGTETRGRIRGQGATTPLKWPPQTTL